MGHQIFDFAVGVGHVVLTLDWWVGYVILSFG